jgi:hypothetical protein
LNTVSCLRSACHDHGAPTARCLCNRNEMGEAMMQHKLRVALAAINRGSGRIGRR